jgi:hypothetical protein
MYGSSLQNVFIVSRGINGFDMGIYIGVLCIFIWSVVGRCLWWPLYKEDLSEYIVEPKEFIEDSFYLRENENEDGNTINENNVVMIYHPQFKTNIIMRYEKDREAFIYWANCVIPFDTLLAICRKYCQTFDAWGIYKGCKTGKEEAKKEVKEEVKENGVFVSVKRQRECVVEEKLNKFIEIGTIRDFKFIIEVPKKNVLDFKTFKMRNIPTPQ